MTPDSWPWPWLMLPAAAVCGAVCSGWARAYARLIDAGASVDGETLRAAWRAVWLRRSPLWPPTGTAVVCAGLLALASLPFVLQPSMLGFAGSLACAVLLLLALIDAHCGLLPDALTLPLLWAGLLLAWAGHGPPLGDALIAAALGYLSLRALNAGFMVWRGRPGLGGGDMKLVAALGAWLGWAPLPAVLLAASLAGLAFALATGRGTVWRRSLAFGPFLAGAGALGLAGRPVVQFLF